MWSSNKPSTWLDSLDASVRAQKHDEARKNVVLIRQRMRERRADIITARKEKMEANQKKLEEKRNELKQKKIDLALQIEKLGGMWKSETEIRKKVDKIKEEKKKISAIYTQLQFHHTVLNSSAPKNYFFQKSYTEKRRKIEFLSTDMIENLVEILKSNLSEYHQTNENLAELIVDTEDQNMSSVLTSKENRDNELLKQKEQIFEKHKVASMKCSAAISKSRTEEYLKDPELLVGKRIKHKVQEKKDSVPECMMQLY